MIDRRKKAHLNRIGFVLALAIAIAEGGLQWSKFPVPPQLGLLMLLIGFGLLAWCSWAIGHHRHPVLGVFALVITVTFYAWMGWLSYEENLASSQPKVEPSKTIPVPINNPQPASKGPISTTASRSNASLYQFTLVLRNDSADPRFYINDQPTLPLSYSSGIGTIRLPAGSYRFRVEYADWTCSGFVSLPLEKPGPVPGNCKMK
jgi:hypothetical protein